MICSWFPSTCHNTSTRHFINFCAFENSACRKFTSHKSNTPLYNSYLLFTKDFFFELFSCVRVLHQEFKSIFLLSCSTTVYFSSKNQTTLFFGTIIGDIFRGVSIGFESFCQETVNISFKIISLVKWRVLLSSHKSVKVPPSLHSIQPRYKHSFQGRIEPFRLSSSSFLFSSDTWRKKS